MYNQSSLLSPYGTSMIETDGEYLMSENYHNNTQSSVNFFQALKMKGMNQLKRKLDPDSIARDN